MRFCAALALILLTGCATSTADPAGWQPGAWASSDYVVASGIGSKVDATWHRGSVDLRDPGAASELERASAGSSRK